MARRRRTVWTRNIVSSATALAGSAAPGTLVSVVLLGETETEGRAAGGTIIRVVGDICMLRTAGVPVISAVIHTQATHLGAGSPTDWDADALEREAVMWTALWHPNLGNADPVRHIDVRTMRKVSSGTDLQIAFQNHAVAGNDAQFVFILGVLILLP